MSDSKKPDGSIKAPHGGVQGVSDMMNHLDPEHRARLMKNIAERDPSLAEKIESQMCTYEHLATVDSKQLALLVREVSRTKLVAALRGSSEDVKSAIFGGLSKRHAEELQQEMKDLGPQMKRNVEEAKAEILEKAKELEAAGKLSFRMGPQFSGNETV